MPSSWVCVTPLSTYSHQFLLSVESGIWSNNKHVHHVTHVTIHVVEDFPVFFFPMMVWALLLQMLTHQFSFLRFSLCVYVIVTSIIIFWWLHKRLETHDNASIVCICMLRAYERQLLFKSRWYNHNYMYNTRAPLQSQQSNWAFITVVHCVITCNCSICIHVYVIRT